MMPIYGHGGGGRAAMLLVMLTTVGAPDVRAEIRLEGRQQVLVIDERSGLPSYWLTCAGPCADAASPRQLLIGAEGGALRWSNAQGAPVFVDATLLARVTATSQTLIAELSTDLAGGAEVQRYELDRNGHTLRVHLQPPAGAALEMVTADAFQPPPLPGFGAAFTDVEAVRVSRDGQEPLDPETTLLAGNQSEWLGLRQRFWGWLAQTQPATRISMVRAEGGRPQLRWHSERGALDLRFYAGPTDHRALRTAGAELSEMLFAALWEPLRWLCFGLLYLLDALLRVIGNPGLAIIALSLAVKIILAPLTRIADRWQAEVNRTQSRLQPALQGIRREYRGEDAHNRTLQAYRDAGVHPLFTMKSLAGFAIQVPMFIAAFDMLADNFALDGARFLWIADLAAPDRFFALPVTLPFFGSHFNLMPALMTLLTIVSALVQRDDALTPDLQHRQRLQLYLMAAGFFLLFYTFPAGMVLYWTANNFWHLAKMSVARWLGW